MYVKCTMTLESAYYNEYVAMWEPFIEPVEHKEDGIHKAWHVNVEVCVWFDDFWLK